MESLPGMTQFTETLSRELPSERWPASLPPIGFGRRKLSFLGQAPIVHFLCRVEMGVSLKVNQKETTNFRGPSHIF